MTDIKLYRPQRLTDNPDGGGLATTVEIVDGQINNLFDDVDRIDRTNGAVSLRKFFAIANTEDASTFLGLHFIVQAVPTDPAVSAFLFSTRGWADQRATAANAVERYLDASVVTRMLPYDRQLAGQRTVLVFQRPDLPLPEIGEVYVLANQAGTLTEFIRVTDIAHRVEIFTDDRGDYPARVITLTISQALQNEWPGTQPNREMRVQKADGAIQAGSLLRASVVSNAARYYGTVPLAVNASIGDLTIKCESVFGQLVPAAVSESPVVNAPVNGTTKRLDPAGASITLVQQPFDWSTLPVGTQTISCLSPMPWRRGTAKIRIERSAANFGEWTEQPDGSFVLTAGAAPGISDVVADSEAGTFSFVITFGGQIQPGEIRLLAEPYIDVSEAAITENRRVTLGNRGTVYIANLAPTPAPGSVQVSYRALGKRYTLVDDGAGSLRADPGVGVGSINYITGTASVTLGALPDVGSSIIFSWGQNSTYEIRTQAIGTQVPEVEITLAAGNCEPGTLEIEWEAGGVTRTATDNGVGGITGDATGRIIYGTGQLALRPTLLPDSTATFELAYESGAVETEIFNPTKSGSTITITAAEAPVRPRSILITYPQTIQQGLLSISTAQQLTDNGIGQLVDAAGVIKAGSAVNYTTGEITFDPDFTAITPVLSYSDFEQGLPARVVDPSTGYFAAQAQFGLWPVGITNETRSVGFQNGSAVTLQYKQDGVTDGAQTQSVPAPPVRVRLTRGTSNTIVPGSVLFTLGGARYVDRGGRLVRNPSPINGAGVDAGTLSYSTGEAVITSWPGGIAPALDVRALLTQLRPLPLSAATGLAPGAPVRPGSLIVQANRYVDGAQITALADQNGNISTADMHGYVDSANGTWQVAFGRYVLASGLSPEDLAAPWYDADAIDADGYIWRPEPALPGTVRFSCVVQANLPLSPEIIGVNPVRLPQDGRVQLLRAGDTLVMHDTQAFALDNPVEAGETYMLPRGGLASVAIYAANGLGVPADLFTVDRVAGSVTMADPLDLTGYTEPLTALHTVEDMMLCTDAQIDGTVTFAQPLTRNFDAANTLVSSALVRGDVSARVANLFAQNTWTNVWSDELIGNPPTSGAAYNAISHPIEVINADCITQRWRIQFTSSTAYNVVGEDLGVIATGTTGSDLAPINPVTSEPYFVLRAAGWGAGWATGNVLRFNTGAAGAAVWVGRCVAPSPATVLDDRIRIQARYDRD
jgi:hypothetical protein